MPLKQRQIFTLIYSAIWTSLDNKVPICVQPVFESWHIYRTFQML